jgi:hypothetical protein
VTQNLNSHHDEPSRLISLRVPVDLLDRADHVAAAQKALNSRSAWYLPANLYTRSSILRSAILLGLSVLERPPNVRRHGKTRKP